MNRQRIFRLSLALGAFVSLCLSSNHATATPPDMTPGIGVSVKGLETTACTNSVEGLPLSLDVVNGTGQNIILKDWDSKGERYLGKDLGNGLAVDGTLFYAEDALTLDDSLFQEEIFSIKHEEKVNIKGKLLLPESNGHYKDIVTIYWSLEGQERVIDTQVQIAYVVDNGCAAAIDLKEYEDAVNPPEFLTLTSGLADQGIDQVVLHRGKAEKTNPAKGEGMDWATPIDLATQEFYDDDVALNLQAGTVIPMETKSILNLTYCARVQYLNNWDHVPEIPSQTTGMRWWLPKDDGSATNFLGLWVELWDKDNSGGDDYIGKYGLYYSANGNYSCMNFTWDQAARGEDFPDVYVKTMFEVSGGGTKRAYLHNGSCTSTTGYAHAWSEYTDLGQTVTTAYHSMNFGAATGDPNARAMNMASAQKFFEIWESYGMTDNIDVGWDDGVGGVYSSGKTCVQLARQYEVNAFGIIYYDAYRRWDIAPHEIGHCYQDQLMVNQASGSYPGEHYGFCSYTDYSATLEGWTEFVAMRTWYPDSASASMPFYPTTVFTYPIEPGGITFPSGYNPTHNLCGTYKCASLDCDCYSRSEIMAARAFWDIWDNNPDNLDTTTTTVPWQDMADIWTLFPPGTCTEGCEAEVNSNMRDYHHNSSAISTDAYLDIWRVYQSGQSYMVCQGWPVP